jgi:hypothetical protein
MTLEEIIDKAAFMTPNDGYEFINLNINKESKFTVRANGRTLLFIGLHDHKNTYRIIMKRGNTNQQFHITSHRFFKRIRRKTWAQFMIHKRKKLIL